jgi:hypothetical protein
LVALCAGLTAIAPAEVRLAGRVVDENNTPVAGARITVKSEGLRLSTVTDPAGAFSIRVPADGDYLLGVESEGYFRLQDRSIHLAEGTGEVTLVLNPVRELLESVDVSAPAPMIDFDKTALERRVSGAEILAVPYPTTHSLRNATRLVPGVVQDSHGGIHVGGGAEEQLVYTLDGFNLSDPLTGKFESRLSVEAVRSLEVSAGRFPAEFGKGSAGTLALKTRSGDDKMRYSATNFVPGIEMRKGLLLKNWLPRFNLSGPLRRGRAWFSDSFDTQYTKQIVEELPKGQDRTTSLRFSNLLSGQINLTPSNILYTGFLVTRWNAPRNGLSALDPPETTVDRRSRQWFFHIKDQIYFRRGALVEFGYAANHTFGREIPQGEGLYILTPEIRRGNFFVDAIRKARRDQWLANAFLPSFNAAGAHQLKVGIDLDLLRYDQNVRRTGYENYRQDGTRLNRVVFGGSGVLSGSNFEASSWIQDAWKVKRNLLFEIGLRQDWDRLVGNTNLAPRIGFAWGPRGLENTKISGGYGIVYDATSLRLFSRPLDQYSLRTYFLRDGRVGQGPAAAIFRIDSQRFDSPRYESWSADFEQRLPANLYARIDYLRKRGRNGFTYGNALRPGGTPPPVRAGAFLATSFDAIYELGNERRDLFDSVEVRVRQTFREQYEWLVSYIRSRSFSNAVVDLNADEPVLITNNAGPMPWDSPNHLLSWGLVPLPLKNWAAAYLVEWHTGFPFSIQDDEGRQTGAANSWRFPAFFELNLHVERRFTFRGHRWAGRAGFNNITNHKNPNVVNNNTGSPRFMSFFGGQGRALNFRIRWLGKAIR